jgi:Type II secretion system (T2SS), protein M subtype b
MNVGVMETLRRQWPVAGALALLLGFAIVNAFAFEPTAKRYEAAVKHAHDLGLTVDNGQATPMLPPRVFALLTDHALAPNEAQERASSGALTASLLEDLNKAASARGLSVLVTEPGPITQTPQAVQVRAHLKMRGGYLALTNVLGDLAKNSAMIALDRFTLLPSESGSMSIELWVSRYVLKQEARTP